MSGYGHPFFNNGACEIWVNGKPLEGVAILDTGAMPLLIGRAGMRQMGWTDKDAVPNAVRLGLADGHSTNLHGLTGRTVKFEFNPGSPTKISIAVRAVVTDAPCDFLVGNIILWTIGATLDAWQEELRYRVDWLKGLSLADDREGRLSIVYTRDPGPPVLPAAQFCASAWAVPTGGEEPKKEEVGSLPDLHDGTESKEGSQEPEGEVVNEGSEDDLPGDLEIDRPWQREWAPDAGRNMATGRMVLSSLPSREYHGPDYEPGVPHIYALRRRFFADIIELHVFRSTEAIIPPPGYEVVARGRGTLQTIGLGGPRRQWNVVPPGEGRGPASLLGLGASAIHGAGFAVPRGGGRRVQLHWRGGAAGGSAHGPARLCPSPQRAQGAMGRGSGTRGGAKQVDALGSF
jgi:hypothetical protein